MERVLVETGVGGVVKIHDYYRNYVLRYEEKIKHQVEKMIEQQHQLELSTSVKYEYFFNIIILSLICNNIITLLSIFLIF